ncbi:MAG: hypothetical protein WC223_13575 [Bacteroidales bacterium]|jgi:hypothetical protein
MSVSNDTELKETFCKINNLLQEAQDYISREEEDPDKYDTKEFLLKFPTNNYIRTVKELSEEFKFISDEVLLKNICFSLILSDFYCWLLNRAKIKGILREMIIKNEILLMSSIAEVCVEKYGYGDTFNKCLFSIDTKLINENLKKRLRWLWKLRQGIHLYLLKEPESQKYNDEQFNKAVSIVGNLVNELNKNSGFSLLY